MTALGSSVDLVADVRAFFRGRALCAAVRLEIAEHLSVPIGLPELAERTGCHAPSLLRLLRGLAAIGVVEVHLDEVIALTEDGRRLRRDHPDSVWTTVLFWADLLADNWSYLTDCVRSGETAWTIAEREGVELRFSREPETSAIFHGAMAAGNGVEAHREIVDAYDFGDVKVVADLGGGGGGLLAALLQANSGVRGVLVDVAGAIDGARTRLGEAGVADRCDVVAHDLFESVPVDADVYVLKHVLHAGSEDEAKRILNNVRARCAPDSKVLVIEIALPPEVTAPSLPTERAALVDLTMLVMTGGRERTVSEWTGLLAEASFHVRTSLTVPRRSLEPLVIIEAVPI